MDDHGNTYLKLKDDRVEWRAVEDEVVVLDVERSTYLAVNAVGAVLWPRLAQGATMDDLALALTERFEIDQETARRDTAAFVDDLVRRGFILKS